MTDIKHFALIGAAGYVAPRHMKAIKESGNKLVAALDLNDSVGVIDSYFPEADFFTTFERFDRHIDKLRRLKNGQGVDYISICSPNYLHDSHIRFALRSNADAICEKPIVLNTWNIDALQAIENETGRKVYTVLQMRLHPVAIALKQQIEAAPKDKKFDVDLTYITTRGKWYFTSWKGDVQKSGGISTNIGVHFFDLLHFLFGKVQQSILHYKGETKESGYLEFESARVRWFLSVDAADLPAANRLNGTASYRVVTINGVDKDLSEGFTDLHLQIYHNILGGKGFGLEENRVAIETVSTLRLKEVSSTNKDHHPFLQKQL